MISICYNFTIFYQFHQFVKFNIDFFYVR